MDVLITDLVRRFGDFVAVNGISLKVPSGRCLALLGPSGCGKTTTLNMVAGFLLPDAGDVRVGDHSVVGIPPHKRNTGMVFQNYALFPHMTVFDNVAYGLRQRKASAATIDKEVRKTLELVRLGELGGRFPRELSGGQQQRVALARALVFEPEILLLDEPLSNLDAKLRETMRVELKEIQRATNVTTIFVTHDQAEAMVLADEVAVMSQGVVEQVGVPEDIYFHPATKFVANFVGSSNFLGGTVVEQSDGYVTLQLDGAEKPVRVACSYDAAPGTAHEFLVRPERMTISDSPAGGENELPVEITNSVFTGAHVDCFCTFGDKSIHVQFTGGRQKVRAGEKAWLTWNADDAYLLKG